MVGWISTSSKGRFRRPPNITMGDRPSDEPRAASTHAVGYETRDAISPDKLCRKTRSVCLGVERHVRIDQVIPPPDQLAHKRIPCTTCVLETPVNQAGR